MIIPVLSFLWRLYWMDSERAAKGKVSADNKKERNEIH